MHGLMHPGHTDNFRTSKVYNTKLSCIKQVKTEITKGKQTRMQRLKVSILSHVLGSSSICTKHGMGA